MKAKKTITAVLLAAIISGSLGIKTFADDSSDFNAKIVTVANTVSYLTIDGKHLKTSIKKLYLDGKETKFTKVSDDGKIIKSEFDGKHKEAKIVTEDGEEHIRKIEGIYNKFPYTSGIERKAPDLVWGHVTIPVWDFHNVSKTEDGRELTKPEKTSFKVDDEAKNIDVISSPTTKVTNYINNLNESKYFVGVDKDLKIAFDLSNKKENILYKRFIRVEIKKNDKTYKIKTTRSKENNYGIITIPKAGLYSFNKNQENNLRIKFAGAKAIDLNIVMKDAPIENVNPNPIEKISNNTIDYGKNISIEYNLNDNNENHKFKKISDVYKVYDDGHEEKLTFSKKADNNIGILEIDFSNSRPIQNKGVNKIKISYKSLSPDIKTYVLKGKSPIMYLNSNSGDYKVGKSLLFTLDGFEYIFQQNTGVKEVYLNGAKLVRKYVPNDDEDINELKNKGIDAVENEEDNGFHVVGNLLRIKNAAKNLIRQGINYITIKYDTYHDTNFKFVVSGDDKHENKTDKKRRARRAAVNVTSSATSGGVSKPSVGTSDSSGGTINMGAKLLYDFDMVANAQIIENLGYKNSQAKKLLDFFEGTAKEVAVFKDNPNRKVVWDSYMNFVQSNRLNYGKYKSFIEYYNSPYVETTQNAPAQIKYVLGYGLGAPIFGIQNIFTIPSLETKIPTSILNKLDNINVRENIVLPLNSWTNSIEYIRINGVKLNKDKNYKVDTSNNELTIYGSLFKNPGSYNIEIKVKNLQKLEKNIIVKNEKDINTLVRINRDPKYQNKIFTGDDLSFEVLDPNAHVTGIYMSVNGGNPVEINENNGLSYIKSFGQLKIDKKNIKKSGKYSVIIYFAGRPYQKIDFDVDGKDIDFVKAPINNEISFRTNQNAYSFKLENYTGNREVSKWLQDIKSVEVNGEEAFRIDENSTIKNVYPDKLSYIISLDNDKTFDSGSYIRVVSRKRDILGDKTKSGRHIKIVVKSNNYADVVFEYDTEGIKPADSRDLNVYQLNPKTKEKISNLYFKTDYLMPEDDIIIPDFDEDQMKKDFPGMTVDINKGYFYNKGEMNDDFNFMSNIDLVLVNGVKQPFGMGGVYIDGNVDNHLAIRFMKHKLKRGDKITIYSKGYKVLHYLVR